MGKTAKDVGSIQVELAEVNDLVGSQVRAGLERDDVLEAVFRSWSERLSDLGPINTQAKGQLTQALQLGPWTSEQRKVLARTILLSGQGGGGRNRRPNQKCLLIENFVPQEVWIKLRNVQALSRASRASLLAGVAHSIGIECPDQPTLYRLVSILAYAENNWDISQDEVHRLMDQMQDFIKRMPPIPKLPYLEHYPDNAQALPPAIQNSAYPSGMPPVLDVPELNAILGDSKMRGRRSKEPAWLAQVPQQYKQVFLKSLKSESITKSEPACAAVPHSAVKPELIKSEPSSSMGAMACTPNPALEMLRVQTSGRSMKPPVAAPHASPHLFDEDDGADVGDIEQMEAAFVDASLRARRAAPAKAMKRAPAKAATSGKAAKATAGAKVAAPKPSCMKIMKKPAASVVFKRPAAPVSFANYMKGVFANLRARRAELTRNQFASHAFAMAKKVKKHDGCSIEAANKAGREQYKIASKLYTDLS